MRSKKLLMLLSVSLLLILNGLNAFAQNRIRVQGTVKDTKGETLVGAMVLVKGTQNGAMTDASGRYSLTGVASNATIVASLIGYEEQEVLVDGRSNIDFILKDDNLVLEEAVAIGYGTQSKITSWIHRSL